MNPQCENNPQQFEMSPVGDSEVGPPSRPSRSTEIAKGVGYLLIRPAKPSAVPQTNLRLTSDNSPPYFDASKAESLIKQGGESRHIRRRVSSNRTERVSTRGRRQCRRAGWGYLGGSTRQCRQAGLVHVSAPTPTLSAGRPLPCRRADFPKPACREYQGGWVIARKRSRHR